VKEGRKVEEVKWRKEGRWGKEGRTSVKEGRKEGRKIGRKEVR